MKRSAPPKRRTRLRRKTPLRNGTSRLKRTPFKRSHGNTTPPSARRALMERSGGRCEACQVSPLDGCPRDTQHPHHVRAKGPSGKADHALANLLAVSAKHHRHIHEHPAESYELGLLRRSIGAGTT